MNGLESENLREDSTIVQKSVELRLKLAVTGDLGEVVGMEKSRDAE